jgi:hypothetical protein
MACRVAEACDHAEHTAKPEIGVAIRAPEEYETEPISRHREWPPRRGMPSAIGGMSG